MKFFERACLSFDTMILTLSNHNKILLYMHGIHRIHCQERECDIDHDTVLHACIIFREISEFISSAPIKEIEYCVHQQFVKSNLSVGE